MSEETQQEIEEHMLNLAHKYEVGSGDYPEVPTKDNQLNFMRDVVKEEDSVRQAKTANLLEKEAGNTRISVLDYLRIARYAESEGLDKVSEYLQHQAFLVSAVSLGRKAKLIETLFTVTRQTRNLGTPKETSKKGLFGSTIVKEGGI